MEVLIGTALGMGTGGVQSHIEFLSHALYKKGVHIELIYPDRATIWWKFMASLRALGNIDCARTELTKIRINNTWGKVERAISNGNFALIHTHDVLLASYAAKFSIPIVLTVHGPLSREAVMLGKGTPFYLKYLRDMERQAYDRAYAIIAVDSGQKDIIVSDYNISPEKIHVIYNGVDTDLFAPQPFQPKPTKPYFLVPRRLVPKNGVHIAIKAFQLLSGLNVELLIAGDGSERDYLERLVRELGMKEQVRFLGSVNREDMVKLINTALGVIIPSIPIGGVVEATSIAALEGMSSGKPVFASNIGGLAEVISDKKTGFLFEAGNYEVLGVLLQSVLANMEGALEIGKQARKHTIDNYSLDVWVQQIMKVYQDVL